MRIFVVVHETDVSPGMFEINYEKKLYIPLLSFRTAFTSDCVI